MRPAGPEHRLPLERVPYQHGGAPSLRLARAVTHLPAAAVLPCPLELQRAQSFRGARYELSLPAHPGRSGSWCFYYLGSENCLNQGILDRAVATLALRRAYHLLCLAAGVEPDRMVLNRMHANDAPLQDQLRLVDVLEWTGAGEHVTFCSSQG